jgi:hypothetical protein
MKRRDTLVPCLLENGANVPYISQWPINTMEEAYYAVREFAENANGVELPDFDDFKEMTEKGELESLEY